MKQITPKADDIRARLLDRADAFSKAHNVSLSRIGLEALNDSKFISDVRGGRNFTIESYRSVTEWMDRFEASKVAAA